MIVRISAALGVFLMLACGGGSARGPFATPEMPASDPLVIDLAECRGDGASVEACAVDRICAHVFPRGAQRFHIRPVGSAPWIQVDLGPDGVPASIELAWASESTTEFEVGLTCAPPTDIGLGADGMADELRPPGGQGDAASPAADGLLTLPPTQRTAAAARAAFAGAEDEGLDGQLVFQHALWLAGALGEADPAGEGAGDTGYDLLLGALTSPGVLELLANTTLDRGQRYRHEPPGHRWPLAQVLFRLRDAGSPATTAVLMALIESPLWAPGAVDGSDEPADWLTLALAGVRPLAPAAASYLRAQLQTSRVTFAVAALVDNESDEAVEILRTYVADRGVSFALRAGLLRENIAAERNLPGPLSVAERLLAGRLPGPVRRRLLEDLFGDWSAELRLDSVLACPDLGRVSPEAAAALRQIAAGISGVPADTRRLVAAGVEQLPST